MTTFAVAAGAAAPSPTIGGVFAAPRAAHAAQPAAAAQEPAQVPPRDEPGWSIDRIRDAIRDLVDEGHGGGPVPRPAPPTPQAPEPSTVLQVEANVANRSWSDNRKNVDLELEVRTPDGQVHTLTDKVDIADADASYVAHFELEHDGHTYEYHLPFSVEHEGNWWVGYEHDVKMGMPSQSVDGSTPAGTNGEPLADDGFEVRSAASWPIEGVFGTDAASVLLEVRTPDGKQQAVRDAIAIDESWRKHPDEVRTAYVDVEHEGRTVTYGVPIRIEPYEVLGHTFYRTAVAGPVERVA